MSSPGKLLFVVNVDWFFLSHRLPIALAAKKAGFQVAVASADTGRGKTIESHGLEFIPAPFLQEKGSLAGEFRMIKKLARLYREIKPAIVHHVTIRPVLYGSIAARRAGVPKLVNALSGLGYVYINQTVKNRLLRTFLDPLFRLGFSHPNHTLILQNEDDKQMVLSRKLINPENIAIIRGSGVDTDYFKPDSSAPEKPNILFIGRILWDKGVQEFVDAAKRVHKTLPGVQFHLFGGMYDANPMSVDEKILKKWKQYPFLNIHGHKENLLADLQQAAVVCLPSYREGLPKALLEAAAVAKPIIATDVPGCREVVENGVNGYLVPVKDPNALADRIIFLMNNPQKRRQFGKKGRQKAIKEFSIGLVCRQTLEIYSNPENDNAVS